MSVKRYWCSSAVELRADGGGTLSANFHANSHFVRASDYDALEVERDGLRSLLDAAMASDAGEKPA